MSPTKKRNHNPSFDNQDWFLWLLLVRARNTIWRARERELFSRGLSVEEAMVLYSIKVLGSPSTAALARLIVREPHTVSALTSRMKRKKLVDKVQDTERKNVVRIVLTEKGERALASTTNRRAIHRALSLLTNSERQQVVAALDIMVAKVERPLNVPAEHFHELVRRLPEFQSEPEP